MQGTKTASRQWNTILHLVLYSLEFVKHVIDYVIYTLQEKYTKDVLMVGYSTYDFRCSYFIPHIFHEFLSGINKYSPVTPK